MLKHTAHEQLDTYFAYGSNMCIDQMRTRCPSAIRIGVGCVASYKLVFNRKGTYRPGAVASIVPCDNGSCVHGVIWRMSADDMAQLDAIEQAYDRLTLDVTSAGSVYRCHTYIAIPEDQPPAPDAEYLALVLRAAKAANLPQAYVQQIARFAQL